MSSNVSSNSRVLVGRHFNICNYTDDNNYYLSLKRYISTPIDGYYPKVLQMFIGEKRSNIGKNIHSYLKKSTIKAIHALLKSKDVKLIIHSNYQTQLTRPPKQNYRAMNALYKELVAAKLFGGIGVVVHTGHRIVKKQTISTTEAINNLIENMVAVVIKFVKNYPNTKNLPRLILETPAGQGTQILSSIPKFARVIHKVLNRLKKLPAKYKKQACAMIGYCIDTCHVFSAGYDLRTRKTAKKFLSLIGRELGFKRLACIHLNDSRFGLDSHRDAHHTIGCGFIGSRDLGGSIGGFKTIVSFATQHHIPLVLETPGSVCSDVEIRKRSSSYTRSAKEIAMITRIPKTSDSVLYTLISC